MRGNGLRSKTHEHAPVQAPARLRANVPSRLLRATSYVLRRGVAGVSGWNPESAFSLQAFLFSDRKEMSKRGKYKIFDYCMTRRQSANFIILYHAAHAAIRLSKFCGRMISANIEHFFVFTFTYHFEWSETDLSVSALPSQLPLQERIMIFMTNPLHLNRTKSNQFPHMFSSFPLDPLDFFCQKMYSLY